MPSGSSGEKTEKATQKKREDERKKGNIFQSRDVISSLSLVAITFVLKLIFPPILQYIKSIMISNINSLGATTEFSIQSATSVMVDIVLKLLLIIVPIGLGVSLIEFLLGGIQTRFLVTKSRLKPKFSRIDPVSGMKRMLSLRSLVEFFKSLIKVIIIAAVLYAQIQSRIPEVAGLPSLSLDEGLAWIGNAIYDITISIAMYMAFLAVADYIYQWWQYNKEIMMTKQEVKDEYKQAEGDPQLKSKIKDVQRKLAQMRMMSKVPDADVVIKNPTHYAVALKYNPSQDKAPIVIAKGKDYLALRIIALAEKNGVYVTENRVLARGLYEAVDLNRAIPQEFYRPVADVLTFIYKLKKSKKGNKQ